MYRPLAVWRIPQEVLLLLEELFIETLKIARGVESEEEDEEVVLGISGICNELLREFSIVAS